MVNDKVRHSTWEHNDDLTDGKVNLRPINIDDDTNPVKKGDNIRVEMHCIDKGAYDYFNTVDNGGGGFLGGSSTPSNPTTNIQGGALGYFSAYTKQVKTVVVQ